MEQADARQICRGLDADSHHIEHQPHSIAIEDLHDADIVFAGGENSYNLSLLKRVRQVRPTLPFVVVTRAPETREWLDALEAGATDYCSMPIGTRELHWLLETALPRPRFAAV